MSPELIVTVIYCCNHGKLPIYIHTQNLIVLLERTDVSDSFMESEVVTAGGQNRFVNLKSLVVNGQNHIQQLTLIAQSRQSPQESVAVAGGRESTTERAVLVVSHAALSSTRTELHTI